MTHFYGSQANPRNLFGENSIELQKFYEMVNIVAPGANMLRQDLIDIWQPFANQHMWVLPDGFTAIVKVMSMVEESFEVNELNSSFTHRYWINKGTATGLSLAANVIHSVDGFVVREMNRRANYDVDMIKRVYSALTGGTSHVYIKDEDVHTEKLKRLIGLAEAHKMVSVVLAEHITHGNVDMVPLWIKRELIRIIEQMLNHKPFALIAIHDCFKCHALYMNEVRQNYIDIFADMADSYMLSCMISQIVGKKVPVMKLSKDLSKDIRQSNYMLS